MSQLQYKPLASLSATLLARKGAAKPAMRPQYYPTQVDVSAPEAEFDPSDCGWNDMGEAEVAVVVAVEAAVEIEAEASVVAVDVPVLRQQQEIEERLAPVVAAPVPVAVAAAQVSPAVRRTSGAALAEGRLAAFTLRLNGDRHLKLRLACTLRGRSAQMLLTDALDRLLDEQSDVVALAAQVNANR
jgi:hypothetical protein